MPNASTLLAELRPYRQWVVRNGDKIPRRASDLKAASVTDSAQWVDFDTALAAIQNKDGYGLGFVLTPTDPFTVIDLDATDDPPTIANQTAIYNAFKSYSERSPSGSGCHIWCKGSVPSGKKFKCVEIYSSSRYMTVTFDPCPDRNIPVVELQNELNELNGQINQAQRDNNPRAGFESQPEIESDEHIYTKAAQAANGHKFRELWAGRWQQFDHYPSQSEADQALYNILAFYTDNEGQVKRMFLQSALGLRAKAKRKDIQARHLKKAFDQKIAPIDFTSLAASSPVRPTLLSPTTNLPAVEVINMSTMTPEHVQWLWKDYLPKGKLTLLAGAAGTGKSTIAFSMAATVSSGGEWPDGTRCNPGQVFIFSTEDDPNDTILPRLIAMGATLSNIHLISTTIHPTKGSQPFDPSQDIVKLRDTAKQHGRVSLLIIDPIVSAITGDMNKSNEVRRGLQTVVDFAADLECAVLGITHFAKGTSGRNPTDRVIGSIAFAAFARIVLVAAKDEEAESDKRVFTRAKSNIGVDSGGFHYSIQPEHIGNKIIATRIKWDGAISGSSREILATVEHQDDSPRGSVKEAKRFLAEELRNESRPARELIDLAKTQCGIHEKTLQRARQQLGIESTKCGLSGGWRWHAPHKPFGNANDSG